MAKISHKLRKSFRAHDAKRRLPRKLKKAIKNMVFTYDISSAPQSLNLDEIMFIFKTKGVLIYDSKTGDKPTIYKSGKNVKVVESSKNETLSDYLNSLKKTD